MDLSLPLGLHGFGVALLQGHELRFLGRCLLLLKGRKTALELPALLPLTTSQTREVHKRLLMDILRPA